MRTTCKRDIRHPSELRPAKTWRGLFQTSPCNGRKRIQISSRQFGRDQLPISGKARPSTGVGPIVHVLVRDNNVDQALRALKKKMQREGIFREMKLRRSFEKPSEKRAREKAEAVRRARKLLRKRMDREGF
jgi:small subunit ribosomal protein S21